MFIENGNGGKLYFEDGTPYCTERPSLNCVEFYGLNDVIDSWSCVNVYKQSNNIASNKIEYSSFNIYPNPAANLLNIDLPTIGKYQISLIDISGKIVKQTENSLEVATVKMNLSGLSKGIYLLEAKNDISRNIQKLVIE